MKEMMKMKKEELVEMVCEMEEVLMMLEDKITRQKKVTTGRKEQVLKVLQQGPITVGGIATRLGITARNVSSQLTYLRKDGHDIGTTSTGKKMIMPS